MAEIMITAKEIHKLLADQNVRIFAIQLHSSYGREKEYWIHPSKTVQEWREDIQKFTTEKYCIDHEKGGAEDDILNMFLLYLHRLGYVEMMDVVADVYEGRVAYEAAKIVPNPDHSEDVDGFGHHGWEARHG